MEKNKGELKMIKHALYESSIILGKFIVCGALLLVVIVMSPFVFLEFLSLLFSEEKKYLRV